MRLERRYSAEQVAGIAIGSSLAVWLLISAISLPDLLAPSWRHSRGWMWYFISLFVLAIAAGVQLHRASEAFKRGVNNELWDTRTLERLRGIVERPLWNVLSGILTAVPFAYMIYEILTNMPGEQYAGLLYFWISPFTTLGILRTALRPKPSGKRIWGRGHAVWVGDMKPIISEHWGER